MLLKKKKWTTRSIRRESFLVDNFRMKNESKWNGLVEYRSTIGIMHLDVWPVNWKKVHGHSGIGTLRAIHENTRRPVEYERNGIVQCAIYHTTRIAYCSVWSLEMVERWKINWQDDGKHHQLINVWCVHELALCAHNGVSLSFFVVVSSCR